jgi:mRNA-degrading endonuclease RelE of RelBE toxin-antitoxin system
MAYRLIVTGDIKKQLSGLPGNVRAIARQATAGLIDMPRPERSKELDGHPGHYRLHIGGYRRDE